MMENIFGEELAVTRKEREGLMGQRALTVWLTGLSSAGKSSIANELEVMLHKEGRHTMLLDGDNIRKGLNKDLSFSPEDRMENLRRVAEVAALMNEAGLIVICAFISPFKKDREMVRGIIGDRYIEVYVDTPLDECEKRDVKGLYKKARAGEIPDFTGVGSPYEVPDNPDIILKTIGKTPHESATCLHTIIQGEI